MSNLFETFVTWGKAFVAAAKKDGNGGSSLAALTANLDGFENLAKKLGNSEPYKTPLYRIIVWLYGCIQRVALCNPLLTQLEKKRSSINFLIDRAEADLTEAATLQEEILAHLASSGLNRIWIQAKMAQYASRLRTVDALLRGATEMIDALKTKHNSALAGTMVGSITSGAAILGGLVISCACPVACPVVLGLGITKLVGGLVALPTLLAIMVPYLTELSKTIDQLEIRLKDLVARAEGMTAFEQDFAELLRQDDAALSAGKTS